MLSPDKKLAAYPLGWFYAQHHHTVVRHRSGTVTDDSAIVTADSDSTTKSVTMIRNTHQALLHQISLTAVLPDKAYDADALLAYIASKKATAVIQPKRNRTTQRDFDRHQYRNRNVIERFFARLKQFRRTATRYDKLASRFSSFVALAASIIWLK